MNKLLAFGHFKYFLEGNKQHKLFTLSERDTLLTAYCGRHLDRGADD